MIKLHLELKNRTHFSWLMLIYINCSLIENLYSIGFVEDSEVNTVFLLKHLELFFQAVYAT